MNPLLTKQHLSDILKGGTTSLLLFLEKLIMQWKYNEDKILKDIEDYVVGTYGSHYCGHNDAYREIQTIDLMAAKDLAPDFCQANILKYGSRYGDKDGHNKRDLLKVIHYAMLLLHFDKHYSRTENGLSEFKAV